MIQTSRPPSCPWLAAPLRLTEHDWPEGTSPFVTIICPTYNHERFIKQCIEGLLMQETSFPVEIILHDDASTDRTPDIIRAYHANHPKLLRPILQTENQMQKGKNFMPFLWKTTRGDCIAFCEGDDYWTSSDKLQQQVEVLQAHPDVTLCYHSHVKVNSEGKTVPSRPPRTKLEVWEQGEFIKGTFGDLSTASVVYRKTLIDHLPKWFLESPNGDICLFAWASLNGRIAVIPGVHSAYRLHMDGLYNRMDLNSDEKAYFEGKLWWLGKRCRVYDHLLDEARAPSLKEICRDRAYREHMEAAWLARLAGDRRAQLLHLKYAFQGNPLCAVTSIAFGKQLLLSLVPRLDSRRKSLLADYLASRQKEIAEALESQNSEPPQGWLGQ